MSVKHPQFILAVTDAYCRSKGFSEDCNLGMDTNYPVDLFYGLIQSELFIAQRNRLDNLVNADGTQGDRDFRQILPYSVICRMGEDGALQFLTYQRGKGVGESRLAGNASIGFGGHIDLEDIAPSEANINVIDLVATIIVSGERELEEELKITNSDMSVASALMSASLISHGILYDNSDDVGRLHLGIPLVYLVQDDLEFDVNEEELKMLGWHRAEHLLDPSMNSESWTKIIAQHFASLSAEALEEMMATLP